MWHQVWPHPEVGAVPAGRPGHVSGHAEAALHEGAGTHRQVLRGVPAGAAVGGGGSQAAAAVVRPAAQQELHGEHVMCACSGDAALPRLSEVSTVWEWSRVSFWIHDWLLICLFTKHICAFAWSKYIQEVQTHTGSAHRVFPRDCQSMTDHVTEQKHYNEEREPIMCDIWGDCSPPWQPSRCVNFCF